MNKIAREVVCIDAPHFAVAIVIVNDSVRRVAPIVSYMQGWTRERVVSYVNKKE